VASRREFIQQGLTASVLTACPLGARLVLSGINSAAPYRLFKVIFDQSFTEGAMFGAESVRRGAPTYAIGGDPGSVWMNEIEPHWKSHPAAVAGLTGFPSLFCLELLARDYGMGLAYCAEHSPSASGTDHHVIVGRERFSHWEDDLRAVGKRWSAVAAAMITNCPDTLTPDPSICLLDLTRSFSPSMANPSLFSWVIGHARRPGLLSGRAYTTS
jgi:hypothetical protein